MIRLAAATRSQNMSVKALKLLVSTGHRCLPSYCSWGDIDEKKCVLVLTTKIDNKLGR